MSIVLELRGHCSHSGKPLVHQTSEDVVLSNVFGVVKNLDYKVVLTPWLATVTGLEMPAADWSVDFWQKQRRPIGIMEGNTVVDLVLESSDTLVFVEVKMDAPASSRTTHDPDRNQIARNLDIGYHRAKDEKKLFALIFVTPDLAEPSIVNVIRSSRCPFPTNVGVSASAIANCLHWTQWATVGDRVAGAYGNGALAHAEARFALDLLAYMAQKGLWKNTLEDEERFYGDKLYRPLRRDSSPFLPYANRKPEPYQGWRAKPWDESSLRRFLSNLRLEDKALLKVLAEAGGAMRQEQLMLKLPMLNGKTSASLRSLKSHVNSGCKALDRAQILAEGTGSGPARIHEIDSHLGSLRKVVIEIARDFDIAWHLLQPLAKSNTD